MNAGHAAHRADARDAFLRGLPFLVYIPGYFLYHWGANAGLYPYVLGGYANEAAILSLLLTAGPATLFLLNRPAATPSHLPELIYLTFLLLFALTALAHAGFATARDVSVSHLASLIQIAAVYGAFRLMPLGNRDFRRVLALTLVVMTGLVFQSAATDVLTLFLSSQDDTQVATYQGLSRAYLWTLCCYVVFAPSIWLRLVLYAAGSVLIFLLGARSELGGLLLFALVFEWFQTRHKARALTLTLIAGLTLWAGLPLLTELFPDNRAILLLDFGSDGSVLEREEQFRFALRSLFRHPVFGDYGSYRLLGGAGSYSHNVISAWVDLGLIGFVMLLLTLACLLAWYIDHGRTVDPTDRAAFHLGYALLAVTVLMLLAAKPFTDLSLAASVALTAQLSARLRARHPCDRRPCPAAAP